MEHQNHNHNNGNGLLMGVAIGVVITLLFTTKKGREILKELTDKGLHKVSDLEKALEKKQVKFEELEEENDYVSIDKTVEIEETKKPKEPEEKIEKVTEEEPKPQEEKKEIQPKSQSSEHATDGIPQPKKTTGKRFFKGLKKS